MGAWVLALIAAGLMSAPQAAAYEDGVEIRAVFVHPGWQWTDGTVQERRAEMTQWLDSAEMANINLLLAWVEGRNLAAMLGEPAYVEEYPGWGTDEWDMYGDLIVEAEERGMQVHLWYSFTRYKRGMVPEYDPDLTVLPPGDPDWASITKAEYLDGHTDPTSPGVSGKALCSNEPDAHTWTLRALEMMVEQYPGLTGLHIEEPGYINVNRCACYRCQAVYRQLNKAPGEDLLEHLDDDSGGRVKSQGTNEFVRRLNDWLALEHPDLVLSFNGGYDAESEQKRGRNWAEWAEWGLVPYYSPQLYRLGVGAYLDILHQCIDALAGSPSVVIPAIGVQYGDGYRNDPETIVEMIEASRALDGEDGVAYGGVSLFAGTWMREADFAALCEGPFRERAVLPWLADEAPTD
jgi:uncharacterized lipoprotein YddW (UPF0748 family)